VKTLRLPAWRQRPHRRPRRRIDDQHATELADHERKLEDLLHRVAQLEAMLDSAINPPTSGHPRRSQS
jgi:hypothetical protein